MKHPRRTSFEALRYITREGLLKGNQFEVYRTLCNSTPLTGAELNSMMLNGRRDLIPGFHKRLSELKDLGVVYEVEERKCRVTGRVAIAWSITDKLPKEAPKRATRPTPGDFTAAVALLEYWGRLAEMRGEPASPEVDKVFTWIKRKAL